jgi:sodium-independent sulfate anion transporter 11
MLKPLQPSRLFIVAVMSLLVGQSITHITATNPNITGPEIAVTLSLLTGAIALAIGLVRLGILVDFIPRK